MGKFAGIRAWHAAMIVLTLLLSACGGGGSSSTVTVPVSTISPSVFNASSVAFVPFGNNSSAVTWGNNTLGELGNGLIVSSASPSYPLKGVVGVSAGGTHTLAIQNRIFKNFSTGAVWAWGNNAYGQLGNGTTALSLYPVGPVILRGKAVAAGGHHSLALVKDPDPVTGTTYVWAWGYNGFGQVGDGTGVNQSRPVQVKDSVSMNPITGVTAIAAGGSHSLALMSNGTVMVWGFNGYGQLGDGTGTNSFYAKLNNNISGVSKVAAGGSHSVALKTDGTVWCWGYNGYGQLGDGSYINKTSPVQVPLTNVIDISAGLDHTVALMSNGTVWAWGYNGVGQLGNNPFILSNTDSSSTPVQVKSLVGSALTGTIQPLSGVKQIMAFGHHTIAVKTDGTVWAWGNNIYGQLGIDRLSTPTSYSKVAIQVPLTGISLY